MPETEIRFVEDAAGRSIAVAVRGQGPLVICPPWWVSHVSLDAADPGFARFLDLLGEGVTLVRYDRAGVGLSDRDAGIATLDHEVALLGRVAALFGDRPYGLFAMSSGGPVALRHAAEAPERLQRICFYGSYLDGADLGSAAERQALLDVLSAHWGVASRTITGLFVPELDRAAVNRVAEGLRASVDGATARALLALSFAMEARAAAPRLQAESLILHREGDRAVPFAAARMLARALPGVRIVALPGSAHPPWHGATDVARLANAFLRGLPLPDATPGPAAAAAAVAIADPFDRANRRVEVAGNAVALTRLQFGLLCALVDRAGALVTRDTLLAEVWRQPFEGSNRIDAVVAGLRRRLGPRAAAVETVIGHGYRFAGWDSVKNS